MTTATQAPASAKGHIDPAAAFVPVQTRSERPTSFDAADFGVPTGREVNWKHTPIDRVRPLLVDEPGAHGVVAVEDRHRGDFLGVAGQAIQRRLQHRDDVAGGEIARRQQQHARKIPQQHEQALAVGITKGVASLGLEQRDMHREHQQAQLAGAPVAQGFDADLSAETLTATTAGGWRQGSAV